RMAVKRCAREDVNRYARESVFTPSRPHAFTRPYLLFDPGIGLREPLFERDRRLPFQDLPEARVVGVPSADALRAVDVLPGDPDSRDRGDQVRQRVDRDQAILAEVQRLAVIASHELFEPRHAVVDIAERARLLAVPPDFDFVGSGKL